jgi:hypothetical protein
MRSSSLSKSQRTNLSESGPQCIRTDRPNQPTPEVVERDGLLNQPRRLRPYHRNIHELPECRRQDNKHHLSRDASGRLTGTATTQTSGQGSSRATYRDASYRTAGSADTDASGRSGSCSKYCDASGRLIGNVSTRRSPAGLFTGIQRDASGRVTDTTSGKCSGGFPVTSPNLKREHPDSGAGDRFRRGGRIDPFQILLTLRAYRANPRKEKAAKYSELNGSHWLRE